MHILYSTAIGTEIIDAAESAIQGIVSDCVIDVDRGKVVALLIRAPIDADTLALQVMDIESWGKRIHIRSADVLGMANDFIRLQPFLNDPRAFIHQRIETKGGSYYGRCSDVQFDSLTFAIEWLFPRKFFHGGIALPASDILEVTEKAIIIKDELPREEKVLETLLPSEMLEDPLKSPSPGTVSHGAHPMERF